MHATLNRVQAAYLQDGARYGSVQGIDVFHQKLPKAEQQLVITHSATCTQCFRSHSARHLHIHIPSQPLRSATEVGGEGGSAALPP